MKNQWLTAGFQLALVAVLASGVASAQDFSTERVAVGFLRPVFLTAPPDDFVRLFVVEQHTGDIRVLRRAQGTIDPTPFLDLEGVSTGNEQGLLGLAFHPDYDSNGYFYVYLTDPTSRVLRFTVSGDPDVADPGSQLQVIAFSQPQPNHNAGWIGFGPDGALYVASGDGGSRNDDGDGHTAMTGNAQDISSNLLGKILRLDVDGDDFPGDASRNYAIPADNPFVGVAGDDEIWAYGLRNPYRASFDRATGDLYIADVGQADCEEIDVLPGGGTGGENFGWRLREGVIQTPEIGIGGPKPPGALGPIFDYPHPTAPSTSSCSNPGVGFEGFSVTGGYVYRGPVIDLRGRYFFADYLAAELWSFRFDGSNPLDFDGTNYTDLTNHTGDPRFTPSVGSIANVSSFGEDSAGRLYVLDLFGGEVFEVPEVETTYQQIVLLLAAVGLARRRLPRARAPRR